MTNSQRFFPFLISNLCSFGKITKLHDIPCNNVRIFFFCTILLPNLIISSNYERQLSSLSCLRVWDDDVILSLGVSTFETNRDRDRERPSRRDVLLKTVEIIHHVEINFFFSRSRFLKSRLFSRDFVASRFLSRPSRHIEIVKIVEICRDAVEMQSRFVEKSRRENTKSMHFSIEIEKNCRDLSKMSRLDRFLGLDRDFSDVSRQNRDISIVETNFWKPSRLSITSRLTFFSVSRSRVSIETTSRQIETPKLM